MKKIIPNKIDCVIEESFSVPGETYVKQGKTFTCDILLVKCDFAFK